MRRTESLTQMDRWELGMFLTVLMAGTLTLAVVWRSGAIPRLFAFAFRPSSINDNALRTATADPLAITGLEFAAPSVEMSLPNLVKLPSAAAPPILPKIAQKAEPELHWYKGEKYRYLKTIRMRVTAYAPDPRCCWPYDGTTTASGLSVNTNRGKLVAADTRVLPFHSMVSVPGYHGAEPVPVLDRGSAIKGQRLDVLLPTFEQAKSWGSRLIDVKVYVPVAD